MKINIQEIARRSNVSIATVSRVLNNKGPVKPETRNKILTLAKQLNYKPSPHARALSSRRTDTIGVILPELVDEYFMDIIQGIDEEAHLFNKYLMISSSHSQRNDIETIMEFMGSGRTDGAIIMAPSLHDEIYEVIKKSKRPVVLLNCCSSKTNVVSFNIDNYRGARQIVAHLIDHGYRKIGMIKGPDRNIEAQARFEGFHDILVERGLEYKENYVISGDFSLTSGNYGMLRLMGSDDKPQAIFAANDYMAIGAYQAARNLNLKIPEDVAIVGFDDIFTSRIIHPRLTTVHVPVVELGRRALNYLVGMIDGTKDPAESYHEELSTGLVIGESCGCKSK
ncbi:MAG: LacI family DNA-binding transcriptional regulator [Calditrichae bacterium]|nr:LacI family DNA-binding transcriptional regulator [Calditrichota bacterium]MCB9058593.1 LacI family DNA-binding transcriptional regulator [Calditrichia bacterium]